MFGFGKKKNDETPKPQPTDDSFFEGIRDFASGEANELEKVIIQGKSGIDGAKQALPNILAQSNVYILAKAPDKLNECAKLRNPDTGAAMLVAMTSERLAQKAVDENPSKTYTHVQEMPFIRILGAAGPQLGVVLNPFDDHLTCELSPDQIAQLKEALKNV